MAKIPGTPQVGPHDPEQNAREKGHGAVSLVRVPADPEAPTQAA